MPISKSRFVLRLFLVFLLGAVLFIACRAYRRNRPDYYWEKACAAVEADDRQSARLYLRNLLRSFPKHEEGHRLMARLCLAEAETAGRPATYAANAEALYHLATAGALQPADLELQKQLVTAYLARREMVLAVNAARRVLVAEPENGDALFALAWRATEGTDAAEVQRLLDRLAEAAPHRPFTSAILAVRFYKKQKDPGRAQRALSEAARTAGRLNGNRCERLSPEDLDAMPGLLMTAVEEAPDSSTSRQRASEAIAGLEQAAQARPERTGRFADVASRIAARLAPAPSELSPCVERLRAAAIAKDQATLLVYHQSAVAAARRGESEVSLGLLARGIRAGEKLPANRRKEMVDLHLLAAQQLMALGRYKEADAHVQALLADEKSAGWGRLLTGRLALQEGKLEQARGYVNQARRDLGDVPAVQIARAEVLIALGAWKEALPLLAALHASAGPLEAEERIWGGRGPGVDLRLHLAELWGCIVLGASQEAQRHFDALVGTDLEPAGEAAVIAGLRRSNQTAEAEKRLAEARQRFPKDPTLLGVQRPAFAPDDMDRRGSAGLLKQPALVLAQAGFLAKEGRVEEAERAAAVLGDPPAPASCLAMARAFAEAAQFAAARRWCGKAATRAADPEKLAVEQLLGEIALCEARPRRDRSLLAEARDRFASVLAAQPANLLAANNLAWLLATEFDRANEAVQVLEKAETQAKSPRLPATFAHTLAVAYRRAGRGADALRVLKEALDVQPGDRALRLEKGKTLYEAGKVAEAKAVLDQVVAEGRADPATEEARRFLASAMGHEGRP